MSSSESSLPKGKRIMSRKNVKFAFTNPVQIENRHMVVLPGYGQENFEFPELEDLVTRSLTRLSIKSRQPVKRGKGKKNASTAKTPVLLSPMRLGGGTASLTALARPIAPELELVGKRARVDKTTKAAVAVPHRTISQEVDATMPAASEGIRAALYRGRFAAIVANRFDPLAGSVSWAKNHMPRKYEPAIASLGQQLTQLQQMYEKALPRVLTVLAAQNANVPPEQLLGSAVAALDEELAEILYVLGMWTDAFGQLRDGMYLQLEAIVFTLEQAFNLFETGDVDGKCEPSNPCLPKLKQDIFKVGNVFMAKFGIDGPATIPGSRGPIGAHVIEVPHDERDLIALMLVLYLHEFRHDIFADVENLAEELTAALVDNLINEHVNGNLVLSDATVKIGNEAYPSLDVLASLLEQLIGEIDADVTGVLLCGPAFLINMLMTFSAFNFGSKSIFAAREQDQLIRSTGYYQLSKQKELIFEPHPPDYWRCYIVAAVLEEVGFLAEAQHCRALADQAVGDVPEFITWLNEGAADQVISIRTSDLIQIAPIIARTLIRTKLQSLGDLAMSDLINWTPGRQAKVDLLAKILIEGKSELPTDAGDIYATYVAAAATLAYYELTLNGKRVDQSIKSVQKNALKMINALRERTSKN
ncbi:hypothetical protein BH10CYA1_BH10CYA1_18170 [soil metagenome]